MRNAVIALALIVAGLAVAAAASGLGKPITVGSTTTTTSSYPPGVPCTQSPSLYKPGVLTVGTDNPAYPPWFAGGTLKGSKWQVDDPSTGKGFESAVAYAVASKLGFAKNQVNWVYTPFNLSFAPGKKHFDFDINEISYTPARAKVVTFSDSYYQVNQALVVLKGTKIARVHTLVGLRGFKLAAQLGTTSYAEIQNLVKPTKQPAVFNSQAAAIQALKNKQVDGLVVDLPTAYYVSSAQVPNSVVSAQFPSAKGGEHFGMVFAKGDPLATCVDRALTALKKNGTLAKIQSTWLAKATGAPVLK